MSVFLSSTGLPLLATGGLLGIGAAVTPGTNTWDDTGTSATITTTTQSTIDTPAMVVARAGSITGMSVTASQPYDEQWDKLWYRWEIVGASVETWDYVENLPSEWDNKNVRLGGKEACFVIDSAGTHTIRCTIYNPANGKRCVETTDVVVVAPSFSSALTFVVAADSDYTGAPTHDVGNRYTTLSAAIAGIQGESSACRISMKPGESHADVAVNIDNSNLVRLDTWTDAGRVTLNAAAGTAPIIAASDASDFSQITFRNIDFRGDWDPVTETGQANQKPFDDFWRSTVVFNRLIENCTFSGFGRVEIGTGASSSTGNYTVMHNCDVLDWRGYGVSAFINENHGDSYYVVGTRMRANPQALNGGLKTDMGNDHGPTRFGTGCSMVYIYGCDQFAQSGWTSTPPVANAANRIHSTELEATSTNRNETIFMCNVVEGGYIQIKIDGQNENDAVNSQEWAGSHLVDSNMLISGPWGGRHMSFDYGGTTARNNLCLDTSIQRWDGSAGEFAVISPDDPGGPRDNDEEAKLYNNTFISMGTDDDREIHWDNASFFTTAENANNVHEQLSTTTVQDNSHDPDTTTALSGITLRHRQVRYNYPVFTVTPGTVADDGTFTVNYADIDRSTGYNRGTDGGETLMGSATATTQSYWQDVETAGNNKHMIRVNGGTVYYAEEGDFEVDFDGSSTFMTFTNRSGTSWSGTLEIRMDRRSTIDTDIPALTVYDQRSFTVPNCRATGTTPKRSTGTLCLFDAFGTERDLSDYYIGWAEVS